MSELLPFAAEMAKARRLDCADGTWLCWACLRSYEPLHVSLHCPGCRREPPAPEPRALPSAGTHASYSVVDDDPAEEWPR